MEADHVGRGLGARYCGASSLTGRFGCGAFLDADFTADYKLSRKVDIFFTVLNLTDAKPALDPADYAGVNYNPSFQQAGIVGRLFKIGVHGAF